jgi:glutaminyl-tRNA synthetase
MENFIKNFILEDIEKDGLQEIITRFPPEPNGYLHIGHARAIITDFELAKDFHGKTNLRFDDTNPSKEDQVFVDHIIEDLRWLGYEPSNIYYASAYFDYMYEKALLLINKGLAYVDDFSAQEINQTRGNLQTPGTESPSRNRSIAENLALFTRMTNGEFANGEKVLRAKIDMASPNLNMRDPVIYRILHEGHHQTKDKWCIYPMYDFAHPLEDAYELITHSLCSLEFEDHRPLYEWVIKNCETIGKPRQIEFGRLSLEQTLMSKRHLKALVDAGLVTGWDDPRLPTLAGLRRKGYTANAIKNFILSTGLSKVNSTMSLGMLEASLRDDLVNQVPRYNGVLKPLKVYITNYTKQRQESYTVPLNGDNLELGTKKVHFGPVIYLDQDDFSEVKPDNKYKRLSLGGEVRLLGIGYFIRCNQIIRDQEGNIIALECTYDPLTKSGKNFKDRKPDGTLSYVCEGWSTPCTFRQFGPLIQAGASLDDILAAFNPDSLTQYDGLIEKFGKTTTHFQLVRYGYYHVESYQPLICNEAVALKASK